MTLVISRGRSSLLGSLGLAPGPALAGRSVPPKRRSRRQIRLWSSCRIARSTTSRSARCAAIHRSPASPAASSTISTAMPARAIRSNSARCRNSTTAKARSRPATCARPPGRAPTPKASNSPRRISSIKPGHDGRRQGRTRHDSKTAVDLTKPEPKTLDLDAGLVFPTEHMVRAITAAEAGKTILNFPVYDGSETGDKVFDTLTVIGRKIAPESACTTTPRPPNQTRRGAALAGDHQLFREAESRRQ